ncbi:MAG TPA: SigB/SigF/SigG family RNA polymerase sigma factor [Armatimonadota bacterium]|nr:SigB/SigF/SigG family RNA polymerase sigma factor [Armatimonadota bacterium]
MPHSWDDMAPEGLFRELRATDNQELREYLIQKHAGLVRHVAKSYRQSGESFDDLVGVGMVGLINAVDRFDPGFGTRFATFAVPTIRGEIRRHFRDRGWGMRVPRRIQELVHKIKQTAERLSQEHGRSPTYAELASTLNVTEEQVVEAVEASTQYDLLSTDALSANIDGADTELSSQEREGALDPAMESIGDREAIKNALSRLPARERVIIVMRYYRDLSQTEIARRLGISQMHVSRLQHRALGRLKEILGKEA